jgi:hypothetical protein
MKRDYASVSRRPSTRMGGSVFVVARRSSERGLEMVTDAAVAGFAGWTVGYQIGFALGLPAYLDAVAGCVCAVAAIVVLWRLAERDVALDDDERSHAFLAVSLILAAGIALAVLSTLMNRPDADDITFFHRAAVQLSHLGAPILTYDTTSNVARLPGPPTGYLLTSYEFLCALLARALGLNPLSVYQNGGCALASAFVPGVYYLLFRRLRLRPLVAVAGVAGVIVFLLLDGNDHHSMGNFAFVRLWQGKAVLMTVLTPYALAAVIRQIDTPGRRNWTRLLCAGVAATGLSTIGCYFLPGYLLVASLAVSAGLFAARRLDWRTLVRRALVLNLTSAYPLVVLFAILFVPFPHTLSPLEWSRVVPSNPLGIVAVDAGWVHQLLWPASSGARMIWVLCLVAIAPFLALPRKWALCIAMFVPAFALLIANPVNGSILVHAVPDVFWRFYFVLPVPLSFGLVAVALVRSVPRLALHRWPAVSGAVALILVAVFAATVSKVTFSPANVGFHWKSPTAWKLDEATVASLGPSLPNLSGKTVLADETAAVELALIDPSIRLVTQRGQNTLVAFSLLGKPAEGQARVRAQAVASGLTDSQVFVREFLRELQDNADALVVRTSVLWLVEPLLVKSGETWRRVGGDSLLTVYVRSGGVSE